VNQIISIPAPKETGGLDVMGWIGTNTTKKNAILRGFLSHLAGVFNLRRFFCGSFENYPRKTEAVFSGRFKTPAKQ
jgi:hypothetical protein